MNEKYIVWQIYKLNVTPQQMMYQIKYYHKDRLFAQMESYNVGYVLSLLNEFRKSFTQVAVEFPQIDNPSLKPINKLELEALIKAYETNQSIVRTIYPSV